LGGVRLVVGVQLAGPAHDLLIGRVAADHRDLDRDRLVGGRRHDRSLAHLLRAGLAVGLGRALSGLAALGATGGAVAPPAHGRGLPRLRTLRRALLSGALRPRWAGRTRALALS